MLKVAIKSTFAPLPAAMGRIVVCLPSKRHVKALQTLLGERISQEEAIDWDAFHTAPEEYTDKRRLIFLEAKTTAEACWRMPAKLTFLAEEVFVMTGGCQLMSLRDPSGCRWGDLDKKISSDSVFAGFEAVLSRTE